MSVKSKVKRCNKEIKRLQDELETCQLSNRRLKQKLDMKTSNETLENIVKFALTNHIGNLRGGMAVDWDSVDKLSNLRLDIEKNHMEHAYFIRVTY